MLDALAPLLAAMARFVVVLAFPPVRVRTRQLRLIPVGAGLVTRSFLIGLPIFPPSGGQSAVVSGLPCAVGGGMTKVILRPTLPLSFTLSRRHLSRKAPGRLCRLNQGAVGRKPTLALELREPATLLGLVEIIFAHTKQGLKRKPLRSRLYACFHETIIFGRIDRISQKWMIDSSQLVQVLNRIRGLITLLPPASSSLRYFDLLTLAQL